MAPDARGSIDRRLAPSLYTSPVIAVTWVLCGLVLDIVGVLILAYGEISHQAAFASYARGDPAQKTSWDYELKRHPLWARCPS